MAHFYFFDSCKTSFIMFGIIKLGVSNIHHQNRKMKKINQPRRFFSFRTCISGNCMNSVQATLYSILPTFLRICKVDTMASVLVSLNISY